MIKYVSNNVGSVTIEQATLEEAIDYCRNLDLVGLDCEFNSLDVFNATLFLIVLGNQERQYVIDARSVDIRKLNVLNDKTFIGHNIKIDLKILALNGVHFDKVYCTMVAEQRLIMGTSHSASLAATVSRHLKVYMSKEERNAFVTDRPDRLVMHDFMIKYAAKDIEYIEKIKESQDVFIARYGMEFLIYDIEMPLVSIMARCDLAGFVLNKDKWLGVIESNKKKIGLLEKECDILVYELIKDNRVALQELAPQANQLDMFSTDIKLSINYNSSNQIKTLFRVLGLEVPTVKEKESVGKDVLAEWLLNNPDHVLCPFIEKYTERSKVAKELSTYGESFLSMVKPDGKIHTVFKQCSTDTGRFSSGDSKYGFPNFQNIPRDNKFRHCFGVEEGYEITTSDLSGKR